MKVELSKILKISAIVVLAVAIVYLIVGMFFLGENKSSEFGTFGKVVKPGQQRSVSSTDELEVNLDKVLINMRSGKYKYMKADMSFKMKDSTHKKALIKNMPRIRDAILRYSASKDSDKMITPEGKEQFKKDVQDIIYDNYGYQIDAIYFRNFVLAQ